MRLAAAANHNVRVAIMTAAVLAECADSSDAGRMSRAYAAVCSASSNREFVIGGAAGSDAGAVTSVPQRLSLDIGHLQAGGYTHRLQYCKAKRKDIHSWSWHSQGARHFFGRNISTCGEEANSSSVHTLNILLMQ